ncbi:unnamed protein product, partial [Brenthis ino]
MRRCAVRRRIYGCGWGAGRTGASQYAEGAAKPDFPMAALRRGVCCGLRWAALFKNSHHNSGKPNQLHDQDKVLAPLDAMRSVNLIVRLFTSPAAAAAYANALTLTLLLPYVAKRSCFTNMGVL